MTAPAAPAGTRDEVRPGRAVRPRRGTARRVLAGGAVLVALGLGQALPAMADGFTSDTSVTQMTGLAADNDHKVYWTAAQNAGQVTALGADGSLKGVVKYSATPTDVQAVAFRDARLWVGDIGDAKANRDHVDVYRIGTLTYGATATPRHYQLSYADQPQDAGAMTVSPRGRVYIVTRGAKPGIYRAPSELSTGTTNTLTRVGDAPANVTDMSFSSDGGKLVLRTLTSVIVLDPYSFKQTAAVALPADAQGLALTTALGGSQLMVSGQGTPVPVRTLALPTTMASVAPAPATPSAAASSSPSASASAKSSATSGGQANRGTLLALVAAGVISVAAAAVVALKR